jgi:hypothetical protein
MTVAHPGVVDRAAIRRDLEATHAAFRELVARLADAKWNATSGNPAWTCGQLAWHLAEGVKFSRQLVEGARKGRQINPPRLLNPLAFKVNEFLVRRRSRGATRASVRTDYGASLAALLRVLDEVRDNEFDIVKTNFGITRTLEGMFRISVEHFAEHGPEIESVI